jgi:hypothetical protein
MLSTTSGPNMNEHLAETLHRFSFMQACKRAAALGLTEGEYRGVRRRMVENFTEVIRGLMMEANTNDPVSVLPDFAASICEVAIAEARKASKESAKHEIQRRWQKASLP